MVELTFLSGTLELRGLARESTIPPPSFAWDARSASFRAEAVRYAEIVRALVKSGTAYEDHARAYQELAHGVNAHRSPRPYQAEALAAARLAWPHVDHRSVHRRRTARRWVG